MRARERRGAVDHDNHLSRARHLKVAVHDHDRRDMLVRSDDDITIHAHDHPCTAPGFLDTS